MNNKFNSIPTDPDTATYFNSNAKLGDYNVKFEKWSWDGIIGNSIIFYEKDVKDLSNEEIKTLVKSSAVYKPDSGIVVKHSESGYVFANFNAEMED
jgi:hypothetical protein